MLKSILQFKLKLLAKLILARYKPRVVGITGSMGKSSCKEAVYAVLHGHYRVRRNRGSYNNEVGLPLTIIGDMSAPASLVAWMGVFLRGCALLLWRQRTYPEILVLEMGADHPGDIDYLLSIVRPEIGVVTMVSESHLEFFGSSENIAKEKGKLIAALPKNGTAILNADDARVAAMRDLAEIKVMTFGMSTDADVVSSVATVQEVSVDGDWGMNWKIVYEGSTVPVFLPGVLGVQQVYPAMAAATVGLACGLHLVDVSEGLRTYQSPPGRMRVLDGVKRAHIIDDTYNAAPASTIAALQVLSELPAPGQRIAVLGDMLELGGRTEEGHREVGRFAAGIVQVLVTVGEAARLIAEEAKASGLSEDKVFSFATSRDARKFVEERLHPGDVVLVKGSRKMRMERVVKEIMAEPLKAGEVLVTNEE